MRNFINIMESLGDDSLVDHIAGMVKQGHHEGYGPYWKLIADPRILEDGATMLHISELISAGFTSGAHPTWELKVVEGDTAATPDAVVDEEAFVPSDPMAPTLDEDDESEPKKHKVVPVHQKNGPGEGWWECPDEHAELYVVEDHEGNPVESYGDRHSAEAHAATANAVGDVLDEDDLDPTDDGDVALDNPHTLDLAPTRYSDDPDYKVEIAAIHERGPAQDEAFAELRNRGIELTDHQLSMAGR